MHIRRRRKIVTDLSANVIEKLNFDTLRNECDKQILSELATGGDNYARINLLAHQIKVGDQFRNQPDTRTVVDTANMRSNYPIIIFNNGDVQPFSYDDVVYIFRKVPEPNGLGSVARIDTIDVGDVVCYQDETDKPLRVYGLSNASSGHYHLMCTPLDVQAHGYGPIHIYGPSGFLVRKRKA